jgi:formylglycine-generating enzyme required for sulfatase activity
VKIPGLPPDLEELLERLHQRGLPITPLELARLHHLLGVWGLFPAADWLPLLSALLCEDERHRTLLRREYARWQADAQAGVFRSGTQAFPIRACAKDWPKRSLAAIQAPLDDPGARQLAIRLLDRGAVDRVLVAPDWERRLADLTQGLSLPDDQLLVFLPPGVSASPAIPAGDYANLAVIRGEPAELAAALDFPGQRQVERAWPEAEVEVTAGSPRVWGGSGHWTDQTTGVTWIRVCGGTFAMGSGKEEDQSLEGYTASYVEALGGTLEDRKKDWERWLSWERPRHPVLVEDFWIARTELTNGHYRALGQAVEGEADFPLVNIDWQDSAQVCTDLPQPPTPADEKWESHLATEAQWEYAARAGSATRWSFGNREEALADYAWFRDNSDGTAQRVGKKPPNGLCLVDMHGNVWEWVLDCFGEGAYSSRGDPLSLDPVVDPDRSTCERRVVRGGSFLNPPFFLRSANQDDSRPDDRNGNQGLRCVRSRVRQP